MSYEAWFITQFREVLGQPLAASDGIDDETINASLGDSPLPSAMRAYYRVAGNHWLNSLHNELRPLDSLESSDGHTIFMDENQLVVRWAVRNADRTTDDPIVYQTQTGDTPSEWHAEKYTFSQFMIAMWHWTLTGEEPD